jgi:phage protein U
VIASDLRSAYHVLFGPGTEPEGGLLASLTHDKLRRCFRQRAMEVHPDRAAVLGRSSAALAERFKQLEAAYRTLSAHLAANRTVPSPWAPSPPNAGATRANVAARPRGPRPAPPGPASAAGDRRQGEARPLDHFWHSGLPTRALRFGEYLYYSGTISWMQLIRALVWQAGQHPRFGRLAAQFGYLTPDSIAASLSGRLPNEKIGEAALRLRLMSALQQQVVLLAQAQGRRRIGDYFVESQSLHPADLDRLGQAFRQHNARVVLAR